MLPTVHISPATDTNQFKELHDAWKASLTAPQDGMWKSFLDAAENWVLARDGKMIGYASTSEEYGLLQFYVSPKWLPERADLLKHFLDQQSITVGMVGTNNPTFLAAALEVKQAVEVDTYLFTDYLMIEMAEKEGSFQPVLAEELESIIDFYHYSMGAPEEWLRMYLAGHVERGEVFCLRRSHEIIGACEVRKSKTDARVADLGMVVSPDYRRQGYGTFLLGKAKKVALEWRRMPICSTEAGNVGSLKSIRNNGFRSVHQMLRLTF